MQNSIINDYLKNIDSSVKKMYCLNCCYLCAIIVFGLLVTFVVFFGKLDNCIAWLLLVCTFVIVITVCEYDTKVDQNITMISEMINYINGHLKGKEMLEYIKIYLSYKEATSKVTTAISIIRNVLLTTLISVIIKGVLSLSIFTYAMCLFVFVVLYPVLTMNIPTSKKELYSQFLHRITLEEQARKIENI